MVDEGIIPGIEKEDRRYVLIVEKDPLQSYLLSVSLRDAGWVVRLAENPEEALVFCEYDLFDVAIINYCYPGGTNGFVLAECFRRQYHLPSLMITACRYSELSQSFAYTAFQDVLFKLYRLSECGPRLQRLITGAPLLREHWLAGSR